MLVTWKVTAAGAPHVAVHPRARKVFKDPRAGKTGSHVAFNIGRICTLFSFPDPGTKIQHHNKTGILFLTSSPESQILYKFIPSDHPDPV